MNDLNKQIDDRVAKMKPNTGIAEWRHLFDPDTLAEAEKIVRDGLITDYSFNDRQAVCRQMVTKSRSGWADVRILDSPFEYGREWDLTDMYCNRHPAKSLFGGRRRYYSYYDDYTTQEVPCAHKAALLLRWEEDHGKWILSETEEQMRKRAREELELEEEKRQTKLRKKEESTELSADAILPEKGETDITPFFDVRRAAENQTTDRYRITRAQELLQAYAEGRDPFSSWSGMKDVSTKVTYSRSGEQYITASAYFWDIDRNANSTVSMMIDGSMNTRCSCEGDRFVRKKPGKSSEKLCEHKLALINRLYEYVMENDPGDATDKTAELFFEAFGEAEESGTLIVDEEVQEKQKSIILTPRIVMDGGSPTLSFKIGYEGGRQLILKDLRNLLNAWESGSVFKLSKQAELDFSAATFKDESMPWVMLLQRRVSETDDVNEKLYSRSRWGYYYRTTTIRVQSKEALSGSMLDRFYDLAQGKNCEYQNKSIPGSNSLYIGHAPLHVDLSSKRMAGAAGSFVGVEVTGSMPVLLYGATDLYTIDNRALSRITKDEEAALLPFTKASDENGIIRFRVGKERLPEFYYRVVPSLLENPIVRFEDSCAEEAEKLLPPEGEYTFNMDVADGLIQCTATVKYGDEGKARPIPAYEADRKSYYDKAHEERVQKILKRFFEGFDAQRRIYASPESADKLFKIQTEAVPVLEKYGTVMGTDAFRRCAVRPAPTVTVGVSIDSGLLELSVLSKGLTPEELLGVLESYREKKKYYRLKSGEFVELTGADSLGEVNRMISDMDLSAADVINGRAQLPAYRALYLDRLLEEHDALAADRDKTYRALIKNFRTIRDADYEVPADQSEVLRPYQAYGYKWLRTLFSAGFGGILADEMGLGKTLQIITAINAMKDEGELKAPALVVCPASLVYNWQEEFRRFAPGLDAAAVAGNLPARKKLLKQLDGPAEERPDVYITSYDLCRKDLEFYTQITFSVAVLDEAQYIKNQKAGLTKAVKGLKAEHRFALTGTPIENRLAELWSIFDFLMPGFLYKYDEFASRIETPVTKNHDEAMTARLKAMVGPFILRRLKSEVLKDLPPKLEEVRYARFEDEQRKIYDGQVVRMKEMILNSHGKGDDRIKIFAELMRIRQICCDPSLLFEDYAGESAKREVCTELIKNAIEGGHRMLVFSQFTSMLALLEGDLEREGISFFKLTGQTPKEKRLRLVHDFNTGDTPVFLISLKAGGTGLNLTGADVVIHYDPWWNVAAQNQATDRAHRIGQQNTVTVYKLIAKDSIEEKILELQEAKRDLADAILSGESSSIYTLSDDELMSLLE